MPPELAPRSAPAVAVEPHSADVFFRASRRRIAAKKASLSADVRRCVGEARNRRSPLCRQAGAMLAADAAGQEGGGGPCAMKLNVAAALCCAEHVAQRPSTGLGGEGTRTRLMASTLMPCRRQ